MTFPKNILYVVDDDHHFIFTLNRALKIQQYFDEVQFFDDPEDGLQALLELSKRVDLHDQKIFLLLDITMPKYDGWEFLEALREMREQSNFPLHIYVISSSIMEEDAVKAISYPEVRAFLRKPITREKVMEILELPA